MYSKWESIQEILRQYYIEEQLSSCFDADADYLKQAYEFTETLWDKNFKRISDLRLVLISEAPLFGHKKSYIYNPDTPPSSFFHFNDLEAFNDGKLLPVLYDSENAKKEYMLERLAETGVIVLDVFPFALNPKHTQINYRAISRTKYRDLLRQCIRDYLLPKLIKISEASSGSTKFAYRYKVLKDNTGMVLETVLLNLKLIGSMNELECIGGSNMSLDRNKLKEIYE